MSRCHGEGGSTLAVKRRLRQFIVMTAIGAAVEWLVFVERPMHPNLRLRVVDGVDQSYEGVVVGDPYFQDLLRRMPAMRQQALELVQRRTGLALGAAQDRVVVRFSDRPQPFRRLAITETRRVDGRQCQVVTFVAPLAVNSRAPVELTLRHEVTHAVVRQARGFGYGFLPEWLREGVAVWSAGQLQDKAASMIAARRAAGQAPDTVINGLATAPHTPDDYLEDGLFFQYVHDRCGEGCVQRVIQGFARGGDYRRLFARELGAVWPVVRQRAYEYSVNYVREQP